MKHNQELEESSLVFSFSFYMRRLADGLGNVVEKTGEISCS